MTFIAAGDEANFAALLDRLRAADPEEHPANAGVVVPLILGLHAFWQGDSLLPSTSSSLLPRH